MRDAFRRARVWAPTAKSAALVLLSFPLPLALSAALIAGDGARTAFTAGALACFWSAAVLVWRALAAEAQHALGQRAEPPAVPLKLLSAILTAGGASLAALAGGNTVLLALIFAVLGGAGHIALYGRDRRPARITVAAVKGVDTAAVTQLLKQAHVRLRAIDAASRSIAVPEFQERLSDITRIGRSILRELERNPASAARARRFLNVYLEDVQRVTIEYVRTHRNVRARPLEQSFRELLVEMEGTFAEQHRRILDRELLSLEVDMEVLNARLKSEGLS